MNRIIKHRKLHGLEPHQVLFGQIEICGERPPLSEMLRRANGNETVYLCGTLDQMTREYCEEPIANGWNFLHPFAFKHRAPVYIQANGHYMGDRKEVAVKLVSHREGWFPGCEDVAVAANAWMALGGEWFESTGLPLLSSPAATGRALLWESLPRDAEFPFLDDDLAKLIRANSPQHRIEWIRIFPELDYDQREVLSRCVQYDGRWMYAAMCGLDRFPVGTPKRVGGFKEYQPGIYDVAIRIPNGWNHVGLIPVKSDDGGWEYPTGGGRLLRAWAFEPELTLALRHGWEIMEVHDGYAFEKGRPLLNWSDRLIKMRRRLQESAAVLHPYPASTINSFAASAVRQILNHTIGAMHRNDFERETFVSDSNFRQWRRENPDLAGSETRTPEKVPGGYLVPTFVQDTSQFSIFMPHWTSTLYSLARARVTEWALLCDPSTLVKINGDAIYSTVAQPELDKLDTRRLGQPRRK